MYGGLAALWILILVWQVIEHRRVRQVARIELGNRARDISTTLGLVIRSQRRFGGLISKERLESALNSLIKPGELDAIALLNASEQVVASAGTPIEPELRKLVPSSEYWGEDTVALMNPVDLGTNVATTETRGATIVLPPRGTMTGTNRPPWSPRGPPPPEPPPDDPEREGRPHGPEREHAGMASGSETNAVGSAARDNDGNDGPNRPRRRRGDGRFPFGRPFWMSEADYQSLLKKQGVHSFVLVLSTSVMKAVCRQDLWVRAVISAFASVSVMGLGFAWRNLARSSDLEVRLARAAELNVRLKEMNLAAAGLAHETRNPLNIIRGLAQLIARHAEAPADIHAQSRDIIAETDRVTAQLNEFINYSRPREVRWGVVPLGPVIQEVIRALASDIQERAVEIKVPADLPAVQGDEQLLRQAFFNLLINAVQAVDRGGTIEIAAERADPAGLRLEFRDNGPGVPPENWTEIFKPYFTTRAEGTGLGLTIVQQIVLAHGWEIECLANPPRGAIFRLSHLKVAHRA